MKKIPIFNGITQEALIVFSQLNKFDEPRELEPSEHASDYLSRLIEFFDESIILATESDISILDLLFLKDQYDNMIPEGILEQVRLEKLNNHFQDYIKFYTTMQKHLRLLYNTIGALEQIREAIEETGNNQPKH